MLYFDDKNGATKYEAKSVEYTVYYHIVFWKVLPMESKSYQILGFWHSIFQPWKNSQFLCNLCIFLLMIRIIPL